MPYYQRLSLFLSLSLGIHFLSLDYLNSREKPKTLPKIQGTLPLEFSIPDSAPKSGNNNNAALPRGGQKTQALAHKLMKGLSSYKSIQSIQDRTSADPFAMRVHVDFSDPATYLDLQNSGREFGEFGYFHAEIYRQIDTRLMYQSLLAQYEHRGWVYFQLDVDSEGKLINESLRGAGKD